MFRDGIHDRGRSGRNFSHSRIGAIRMSPLPSCSSESADAQVLRNLGFFLTRLVAELAVCIVLSNCCGTVVDLNQTLLSVHPLPVG